MDYSIDELDLKMREIINKWHLGTRQGNDGDPGNTLEDLLGIQENNFSLPDFGRIEIKTKKSEGGGLLTLFHKEPKPSASVPKLLLSMGWRHQKAGKKYPENEKSFRSTTPGNRFTCRGYKIEIDENKIYFIFNKSKVEVAQKDDTGIYQNYGDWLKDIENRKYPHYSNVIPLYYDLDDVIDTFKTKLSNTMLAFRKTRTRNKQKYYLYDEVFLMDEIVTDNLPTLIRDGSLFIDFDARTGHNHGTKFRIKKSELPRLFSNYKTFAK